MSFQTWKRWPHDCPSCRYLGSGSIESEQVDWYFCDGTAGSSLGGTILGRYGLEPHQYWSMPKDTIDGNPELGPFYQVAFSWRQSIESSE